MIRNLLTLAVVAGLVYGAYLVNEKFFSTTPPATQKKQEPIPAGMVSLVCPQDVQAFDPTNSDKPLGYFKKGTEIKVGSDSRFPGMKSVAYQPSPTGEVIRAICKTAELNGEKSAASATAPLAKKATITTKAPGVTSTLGSGGQNSLGQPAKSTTVLKLGATNAKSISTTFGDTAPAPDASTAPPVPASTAKSPEQGIKDRAKDLQNPQNQ